MTEADVEIILSPARVENRVDRRMERRSERWNY